MDLTVGWFSCRLAAPMCDLNKEVPLLLLVPATAGEQCFVTGAIGASRKTDPECTNTRQNSTPVFTSPGSHPLVLRIEACSAREGQSSREE